MECDLLFFDVIALQAPSKKAGMKGKLGGLVSGGGGGGGTSGGSGGGTKMAKVAKVWSVALLHCSTL